MNQPNQNNEDPDGWKSTQFRKTMRVRFEEEIKQYQTPFNKNINEIENSIFNSSKTKDEYFQNCFRILKCIRDRSAPGFPQNQKQTLVSQPNQHQQQQQHQVLQPGMVNQTMVTSQTDPMSALQNLASCQNFPSADNQSTMIKTVHISNMDGSNVLGVHNPATMDVQMTGTPNQAVNQIQMGSSGVQQVNSGPGGVQMQTIASVQGTGMQQIPGNIGTTQIQMTSMNTNGPMVPQQRLSMATNRMIINQMLIQPTNNPSCGPSAPKRPQMVSQAQIQRLRSAAPNMTIQPQMPNVSEGTFYQTQITHRPAGAQNFALQQQPPQQPQQQQGHQMMMNQSVQNHPSPGMNTMNVSMSPSAGPFTPSPSQGLMSSPMSMGMMGHRGPIPSIPSPSPLNTPQMITGTSPASKQMNDEQAYCEKLKNLSRYIEPLRARLEREESVGDKKKDLSKIRNLLNIISDNTNRVSMELLLKCESLLERMDFGNLQTSSSAVNTPNSSVNTFPLTTDQSLANHQATGSSLSMSKVSEQNIAQPLMEALTSNIKKPYFNHTLFRTFAPALSALTNNSFKNLTPPLKKSSPPAPQDIPDVIQGEVARLDSKFKVQLHPLQQPGAKSISLICHLDDQDLPCVPPISIKVPDNYPSKPPQCYIDEEEYSASSTLLGIKKYFDYHIGKLPDIFSIMTLLNRWELSVRQACNNREVPAG